MKGPSKMGGVSRKKLKIKKKKCHFLNHVRGQLKIIFQKLFRNLKNNTFEIYSNFKHKETPGEAGRNHESVK